MDEVPARIVTGQHPQEGLLRGCRVAERVTPDLVAPELDLRPDEPLAPVGIAPPRVAEAWSRG